MSIYKNTTKEDIIRELARKTPFTQREVRIVLEAFLAHTIECLTQHRRIVIENWFIFEIKQHQRQKAQQWHNGAKLGTTYYRIKVTPSKYVKAKIRKGEC